MNSTTIFGVSVATVKTFVGFGERYDPSCVRFTKETRDEYTDTCGLFDKTTTVPNIPDNE
jgi:hypothetical protein